MSVPQFTDWPVEELSFEESWELLESQQIGRLAYRLIDEVHLVPINYATEGRSLMFRTGSGSKLLAAALESDVAFEIDHIDTTSAWSVVARGHLRRLDEADAARIGPPESMSWIATPKDDVVELLPEVVTGRRFRLRQH